METLKEKFIAGKKSLKNLLFDEDKDKQFAKQATAIILAYSIIMLGLIGYNGYSGYKERSSASYFGMNQGR